MTPFLFLQLAGPCTALIAGIGICVFLIRNVKSGARRSEEQVEAALAELRDRLKTAEDAIVRLRSDLQTVEEQFRVSAGVPAKSWSNITRRTQALRMLKAGQKPQRIAAELGMSAGEVDLIAKVTRIVTSNLQPLDSHGENEDSTFSISA
jgi:methylphosphotriester-DNA--protein-cysteine methyltransferase